MTTQDIKAIQILSIIATVAVLEETQYIRLILLFGVRLLSGIFRKKNA